LDAFIAIGGIVLSAIGFLATLFSLWYAIRQVKKAKSAAEAARDAAQATLAQSKQQFVRYVAGNSQRFVNEVIIYIRNRAWHLAALRLNDLADQLAQMAIFDPECQRFVEGLRTWSATLHRLDRGEITRFAATRWADFLLALHAKIDSYYGPFPAAEQELDNDPRRENP
jgi:hypothetical protein